MRDVGDKFTAGAAQALQFGHIIQGQHSPLIGSDPGARAPQARFERDQAFGQRVPFKGIVHHLVYFIAGQRFDQQPAIGHGEVGELLGLLVEPQQAAILIQGQ